MCYKGNLRGVSALKAQRWVTVNNLQIALLCDEDNDLQNVLLSNKGKLMGLPAREAQRWAVRKTMAGLM